MHNQPGFRLKHNVDKRSCSKSSFKRLLNNRIAVIKILMLRKKLLAMLSQLTFVAVNTNKTGWTTANKYFFSRVKLN